MDVGVATGSFGRKDESKVWDSIDHCVYVTSGLTSTVLVEIVVVAAAAVVMSLLSRDC